MNTVFLGDQLKFNHRIPADMLCRVVLRQGLDPVALRRADLSLAVSDPVATGQVVIDAEISCTKITFGGEL